MLDLYQAILADAQALGVSAIACSTSLLVIMIIAGKAVLYSAVRQLLSLKYWITRQVKGLLYLRSTCTSPAACIFADTEVYSCREACRSNTSILQRWTLTSSSIQVCISSLELAVCIASSMTAGSGVAEVSAWYISVGTDLIRCCSEPLSEEKSGIGLDGLTVTTLYVFTWYKTANLAATVLMFWKCVS